MSNATVGDYYDLRDDREGLLRNVTALDGEPYFHQLYGIAEYVASAKGVSVDLVHQSAVERDFPVSSLVADVLARLQERKKELVKLCAANRALQLSTIHISQEE